MKALELDTVGEGVNGDCAPVLTPARVEVLEDVAQLLGRVDERMIAVVIAPALRVQILLGFEGFVGAGNVA